MQHFLECVIIVQSSSIQQRGRKSCQDLCATADQQLPVVIRRRRPAEGKDVSLGVVVAETALFGVMRQSAL